MEKQKSQNWDTIANLAVFLTEKTGSCFGTWDGRMTADQQRALFGANLFGKKRIIISGQDEMITTVHKVCFGTDYEANSYSWRKVAGIEYPTV